MNNRIINTPVFIIGHPRSGTTFLHRYILNNFDDTFGLKLKDILFSASGVKGTLIRNSRYCVKSLPWSFFYDPAIHRTSPNEFEVDDIAYGLNHKFGYLYWLYFDCLRLGSEELIENFYRKISEKKSAVLACWNNLYSDSLCSNSKIVFSKSFIFLFYFEELLKLYPDCRIIVLSRNPADTVPSTFSLLDMVYRRLFWYKRISQKTKQLYFNNVYNTILEYYTNIKKIKDENINSNNIMFINYDSLINNFAYEFYKISEFSGLKIEHEFSKNIDIQARTQQNRVSNHIYSLKNFNIDIAKIKSDFEYFY